ncbi:MAG: hypothetical protein ACP5MZ_01130 [Candidatus Micrarchaeia archaeon]
MKGKEAGVKNAARKANRSKAASRADMWGNRTENEKRKFVLAIAATVIILLIAVFSLLLTRPTNTLSSCGSRAIPGLKYSCYEYFANQTLNASICSNLPAPLSYSCISNVALLSLNSSKCIYSGLPTSYRDSCLEQVGISSRNPSVCAEMNSTNESMCAYGVAQAQNFSEASACSYINNNSLYDECYSRYYYQQAAVTKNYTYCNYLPNVPNATLMTNLLSSNSNLTSISNAYIYSYYNVTPQGLCYSNVAYLAKNKTICSALSGINSQLCIEPFITIAPSNESTLLASCSKVPADLQEVCREGILVNEAVDNANISICLSLNQTNFKDSCISEVAAKVGNSTYCSYISNATEQEVCASYFNISR